MSAVEPTPKELPEQFGRYRILKKLGAGGMGAVYLAEDQQLERRVALKVPRFGPDDGPEVLERFYREARAAAKIVHPNICRVYDVGEEDGIPYLTMDYIEGKPLTAFADGEKLASQRQVALTIRKIAMALQEAHHRGIIHRDLKPSNIMITRRSEPVVMDFGLAREVNREDARITASGAVLGTPAYMPPEQVRGDHEAVGPASDVYSLGIILYELLTGELPFAGPPGAVLGAILHGEPASPSTLRTDIDPQLEALCMTMIAKEVENRFDSMAQLAEMLTEYLRQSRAAQDSLSAGEPAKETVVAREAPAAADQHNSNSQDFDPYHVWLSVRQCPTPWEAGTPVIC